ncbi:MAG: PSD1 domain-containing protein [Verrucomicrobiae bacterium]|nr:PSD1 domain-containing protein [Verrucomicrobiae bacterium]
MARPPRTGWWGAILGVALAPAAAGELGLERFERRIRPALIEHCFDCHSAEAPRVRGGLRVDSLEGLLRGGETGPAIVPGDPERSSLWQALTYEDPDLQMPPKSRLPDEVIEDFRVWLAEGAPWPEGLAGAGGGEAGPAGFDLAGRREAHWAWHPVRRPEVPEVSDPEWAGGEIDRFVLARLEAEGLKPGPAASRPVLIRRATWMLTGLPPTPEEVEAFVGDGEEGAFARVVDRLLASPHYGERWARHWLDKVRYAETMGHEFDYPILGAWRYRDYVVRAFHSDLPYERFVREQIAGDLLPDPRWLEGEGINESAVGTLQYWFCQQVHSPVDVRNHQIEVVDNQIDVVTKAFLGMTVSCARCHDHKFDAISARDYFALAGILGSSRYAVGAVDDPAGRVRLAGEMVKAREALRRALADGLLETWAGGEAAGVDVAAGVAAGVLVREGETRWDGEGWMGDGEAFTADGEVAGQPRLEGDGAVRLVRPGWRDSGSLSRRFQGRLTSTTRVLDRDFVHVRMAGSGARFGVVIEGFTLIRAPIYGSLRRAVNREEPHWVTVDVSAWKGRRAYLEFSDLGVGDPASELGGGTAGAEGWLAVGEVVLSPHREPPGTGVWTGPTDGGAVLRLLRRWRDAPGTLSEGEVGWIEEVLGAKRPEFPEGWKEAWDRLESGVTAPVLAGVMSDGTGWDEALLIRGNHRTPGDTVPRGFLEALAVGPGREAYGEGSGRLALAEALTDGENPLTWRVMANWVWAHLMGRGLVASVDNFGVLGEAPSHPELLDWLADTFRSEGGSVKRLVRRIVLSRAWQAGSGVTDPAAEEADPDNRWWHRAHVRRLEGEAIRDGMLALSGRLDRSLGGPPVPVHLTPFMEGRGRPGRSGPLDGEGRRSLYLEVRRNFPSPFLLVFDTPVPATTVGWRSVSNVPAQALALMNDPMVVEEARRWADRLAREVAGGWEARVDRAYREAYGRSPDAEEWALAREYLAGGLEDSGEDGTTAWGEFCHALWVAKEFQFIP